jgi:hypothetical protein
MRVIHEDTNDNRSVDVTTPMGFVRAFESSFFARMQVHGYLLKSYNISTEAHFASETLKQDVCIKISQEAPSGKLEEITIQLQGDELLQKLIAALQSNLDSLRAAI